MKDKKRERKGEREVEMKWMAERERERERAVLKSAQHKVSLHSRENPMKYAVHIRELCVRLSDMTISGGAVRDVVHVH